jgi:hypothetical protein
VKGANGQLRISANRAEKNRPAGRLRSGFAVLQNKARQLRNAALGALKSHCRDAQTACSIAAAASNFMAFCQAEEAALIFRSESKSRRQISFHKEANPCPSSLIQSERDNNSSTAKLIWASPKGASRQFVKGPLTQSLIGKGPVPPRCWPRGQYPPPAKRTYCELRTNRVQCSQSDPASSNRLSP